MERFYYSLPPPYLWVESFIYSAPYRSHLHSHPAWQLTLSLEGDFFFEYEENTLGISPGEWVLFSPELPHRAGSRCKSSIAIQLFFRRFPQETMPEFAAKFNFLRNFCMKGSFTGGEADKLAEELMEMELSPISHTLKNLLPQNFILHALQASFPTLPPGREISQKLLPILEYMETNYMEAVSATDLAALAGLSESRFNEIFHKYMGLSPIYYLNEIRLSHAQTLLLAGETLEKTAKETGFRSSAYFCRKFKKYTGTTPGGFRRKASEGKG